MRRDLRMDGTCVERGMPLLLLDRRTEYGQGDLCCSEFFVFLSLSHPLVLVLCWIGLAWHGMVAWDDTLMG